MGSQPTWTTAFPLVEMIIVKTNTTRWAKAQDTILSEKKKKERKQNANCIPALLIRTTETSVPTVGQRLGGKRKVKSFIC